MRLLPHQQRSVCMWGCSSDTDGVTEPSTGLWSRAGGQGRTELPLSRRRPPSLLITRCPAPSLLPFLVLGGSKGNSRLFFFFFFFFFSNHFFTDLCVKALRQGREMLALDPGQGPPQMDAIRWRRTSLRGKCTPHSMTQALKPDPEQGDDEQPLQTGFHTTDRR